MARGISTPACGGNATFGGLHPRAQSYNFNSGRVAQQLIRRKASFAMNEPLHVPLPSCPAAESRESSPPNPPGQRPGAEECYRTLFDYLPIPVWEEDWTEVRQYLAEIARGVDDLDAFLREHPEVLAECDRRLRILDVNRTTLEFLGASTPEELVRQRARIFTNRSWATFRQAVAAVWQGAMSFQAETSVRSVAGREIEVQFSLRLVPDPQKQRWLALACLVDITERKQSELALQRERKTLEEMLELQEHERRLIGYDIHDGLAQQMGGALMFLQAFRDQFADRPPEQWKSFDQGLQALSEAMAEARRLVDELRPLVLEEGGILPAVEALIEKLHLRFGMEIEYLADAELSRLAPVREFAVFRIVQEALTNARRHSRSKKVRVEIRQRHDHLYVEVRDWGAGFDPQKVRPGHYGLEGIRERGRLLGGQVHIDSAPGEGTRIALEIPTTGPAESETGQPRAGTP